MDDDVQDVINLPIAQDSSKVFMTTFKDCQLTIKVRDCRDYFRDGDQDTIQNHHLVRKSIVMEDDFLKFKDICIRQYKKEFKLKKQLNT